ncbi:MAG: isoprenoid biosynthesis glyoxalase ElbB [Legionellaceae bacterium]|nr:isoprenoid biosynthesis glyoxalase ElbB [Legionellaceae bacterium]
MTKFAIVLAGCGQHDGSETHEVILTLLSMDQAGVAWDAFAPDVKQACVINHITESPNTPEERSVLQESARLVRGKIKPITMAHVAEYDAIIFPGGLGAVTTLCDWFEKKSAFNFNSDVKHFIDEAVTLKKPMGFICIAPMMITKIYPGAKFTIGNDPSIADQIQAMGCLPINCPADDVVIDETHKIVSTPANMVAKNINDVYVGINKLVQVLARMSQCHET